MTLSWKRAQLSGTEPAESSQLGHTEAAESSQLGGTRHAAIPQTSSCPQDKPQAAAGIPTWVQGELPVPELSSCSLHPQHPGPCACLVPHKPPHGPSRVQEGWGGCMGAAVGCVAVASGWCE